MTDAMTDQATITLLVVLTAPLVTGILAFWAGRLLGRHEGWHACTARWLETAETAAPVGATGEGPTP